MTSHFEKIRFKAAAAFGAAALALAAHAAFASSVAPAKMAKHFTWSAELVSYDSATRMLTLKSLIDNDADITKLPDFEKGQTVTLWWTGLTQGSTIRNITVGAAASVPADALVLPAHFVRTEMNDHYVVYRLRVPAASAAEIRRLKPGTWVTGASPRHARSPGDAVTDVHAYNDVG